MHKGEISIESKWLQGREQYMVNARDLHRFLDVGDKFATWIAERILRFRFEEGRDYEVFLEMPKNPTGGRPAKEYALTLDMAKELAMVERTDKGKEARAYFIECERHLRERLAEQPPMEVLLNDPAWLRNSLITYTEKVIALEATVAVQAPKVEALERISGAEGDLCVREAAKVLKESPKRFVAYLLEHKWVYRHASRGSLVGYQDRVHSGHLTHRVMTYTDNDGHEQARQQVLVTPKGLTKLAEMLSKKAA